MFKIYARSFHKARSIENELNTFDCDNEVASINRNIIDFKTIDHENLNGENSIKSAYNNNNNNNNNSTTYDFIYDTQSEHSLSNMNEDLYSVDDSKRASLISASICHECNCCKAFKEDLAMLERKLRVYESLYAMTPSVLNWFEHLKASFSRLKPIDNDTTTKTGLRKNNIINMSDLSINQNNNNTTATVVADEHATGAESLKKVPEIVIENIV